MKMIMVTFAFTLTAVASAAIVGRGALRASGSVIAAPLETEAHSHKLALAAVNVDRLLHLLNADEKKSGQAKQEPMKLPWMEKKSDEKESKGKKESQKDAKKNNAQDAKKQDHKDEGDKDKKDKKDAPAVATEGNFEDFLPGCLVHTAELVQSIDASYTDMQIQTVLENECLLKKEFPTVVDHGFDDHGDCMHFAESLSKARHAEVREGSTDGYKTFCKEFFENKARPLPGLDEAVDKAAGHGFSWVWRVWVIVIAFGIFLAVTAAIAFTKKR